MPPRSTEGYGVRFRTANSQNRHSRTTLRKEYILPVICVLRKLCGFPILVVFGEMSMMSRQRKITPPTPHSRERLANEK